MIKNIQKINDTDFIKNNQGEICPVIHVYIIQNKYHISYDRRDYISKSIDKLPSINVSDGYFYGEHQAHNYDIKEIYTRETNPEYFL